MKYGYIFREQERPGRMGGDAKIGPGGTCVCPKCGTEIPHKTGEPCSDQTCPECGAAMVPKKVPE